MKRGLLILITGFLLVFSIKSNAQNGTATTKVGANGNWNSTSTWIGDTIPTWTGNAITINSDAIVNLNTSSIVGTTIYIYGTVNMSTDVSCSAIVSLNGTLNDGGHNLTITKTNTTVLTGSGTHSGTGSIILTGNKLIKVTSPATSTPLTLGNLTVNQATAPSLYNNICEIGGGALVINGTLTLNSTGAFCLNTKSLTLNKPVSNDQYFSGSPVYPTYTISPPAQTGTAIPSTGSITLNSSTATIPNPSALTTLMNLTINVGSGNTYHLPNSLTIAPNVTSAGNIVITSGTLSVGSLSLIINTGGIGVNSIAPGASLNAVSGGTVNFNGQPVTIQSDATGTGSIGVFGTLSGISNVTVQRYIGSSQQWRMVGFPFTAATTISETALAGFYTSGYNAYTYNESADDQSNYGNSGTANAGWTAFTSGTINANQGLLLSGGTISSTISFTGPLNTGTQNIPLTKSKSGWNLIANPFASNINWTTVASDNSSLVNNAIYRYDPNTTAYASYVSGSSTGNQNNVIENGASFFVQAISSGNLSISELAKLTGSSAPLASLFGLEPIIAQDKSIIKLSLLKEGETYGDEVVLRWGVDPATDGFDGKYDAYDLGRVKGADLSVIGNDGTVYSIFHGSELKSSSIENRTVQLGIKNIEEGNYTMGIQLLSAIAGNNKAYLFDSYTNQYTLMDGNTNNYNFLVTSDAKSQSATRFEVVMNYKAPENTVSTNLPVMLLNNPSSGNLFSLYSKNNYKQLQWQIIDASGRLLQAGLLSDVLKGSTHQISAGNAGQGNYFIKLTGDGNSLPVLKALKN